MKDSGIEWIGEIPSEITLLRIKYLIACVKGKIPETLNKEGLGVPYIGANEMNGNKQLQYTEDEKVVFCNNKDILLLWDGANAGLVATGKEGAVSSTVVKLSVISNKVYSSYVYYLLKYAEKYFKDKVNGTTIPHMNFCYIDDIPFIAFNYDVQQKIADFLDKKCSKIDSLIAHEEATIEELKAYKQSVITEAVTKGLDKSVPMKDSGVEWVERIPERWNIKPIKALFSFGKGLPITKADLRPSGTKVISYGQIHAKYNKSVTVVEKMYRFVEEHYLGTNINSIVKKGSFIFADTSEDVEGAGDFIYIDNDDLIFAGYHSLVLQSKHISDNKYLAYLFMSSLWKKQIRCDVCGVKVFSISRSTLSKASVLLPSKEEQKQIVTYLDKKCAEMDNLISIKQQKIEELKEYKKSLIYEFVTGKKEVA